MSIRTKALRKGFEGAGRVVDDVSLEVASGDFVALLGPSGCGKSTFLRLVAGLETPDSGEIEFASGSARGFVFQDATLMPWKNTLKNVMLPLELGGIDGNEAEARAREELSRVGLENAAFMYPHQLSGGMKMRVSVARALASRPSALFLDEPFAALDEPTRHQLQDELKLIWKALGMTVLFVTHSVAEAVYLAERIVVFSAKPARIVRDMPIRFTDQSPKLRLSNEYLDYVRELS